jgi:hypothetical protein
MRRASFAIVVSKSCFVSGFREGGIHQILTTRTKNRPTSLRCRRLFVKEILPVGSRTTWKPVALFSRGSSVGEVDEGQRGECEPSDKA